jgi:2-keto-4-pentenoate hydratase
MNPHEPDAAADDIQQALNQIHAPEGAAESANADGTLAGGAVAIAQPATGSSNPLCRTLCSVPGAARKIAAWTWENPLLAIAWLAGAYLCGQYLCVYSGWILFIGQLMWAVKEKSK